MKRKVYLPAALLLGTAGQALAGTAGPMPEDMSLNGTYTKPGFEFCTKDKANCLTVGGSLMVDWTYFSRDSLTSGLGTIATRTGADLRRARLHMKGTLASVWDYKLETELNGDAQLIKDAFIRYTGMDSMYFTAGQFRPAYNTVENSELTTSNFMERALAVQAFGMGHRMALQANFYNNWMTAAVGVFGADYNGNINGAVATAADMPFGVNGRVMFQPWNEPGRVAAFGVGAYHQDAFGNATAGVKDTYTFNTNLGLRAFNNATPSVVYGSVTVDNVTSVNVEGVYVQGPFDAEAAYIWTNVNQTAANPTQKFKGYYVQAGYFLTGESRVWNAKDSTFAGKTSNNSDTGAFQVAARYDVVNMTNNNVAAGVRQDNVTVGLNYYPVDMVKLSANYIHATFKPTGAANTSYNMLGLRAQALV